ncbi:hypothetical protein [Sulfobacillus sp. hq2]|uniref:Uncharacterized protein n=1 Tax=Sulfobacillus thermotolerans TaxID=338644 RepID=A0ABM6RP76_9FIRM|nr:hypothetical protein [Sulfobacillus sp. hq2]AUW93140.1 hypothetical protein BXT84_03545 [Sulfobacillus thermotolerans]POB10060.1 hypothetical protein CO251_11735 [Sulfobacillus sp. hq2]
MERSSERNPNKKFDQGFLGVGLVLAGLLVLGVDTRTPDLITVDVMTIALWLSVGAAMVISRFNQGRWE